MHGHFGGGGHSGGPTAGQHHAHNTHHSGTPAVPFLFVPGSAGRPSSGPRSILQSLGVVLFCLMAIGVVVALVTTFVWTP